MTHAEAWKSTCVPALWGQVLVGQLENFTKNIIYQNISNLNLNNSDTESVALSLQ